MSNQAREVYAVFLEITETVHKLQAAKRRAIENEQRALQAQQKAWNLFLECFKSQV